jgi:hypothetical protein
MKMKPEDLAELKAKVQPHDTPDMRAIYRSGKFPRAELVKDLNKRFRWDLFWMVPDRAWASLWTARVYDYCNDDHIDTALRSFIPSLEEK